MKIILKLILLLMILSAPSKVFAQIDKEGAAVDLREQAQTNEVILNTDSTNFDEEKETFKQKFINSITDNSGANDDDDSVMDNSEADFEIFKMFDKDNDDVIDENTWLGKIYHSKITRTDIPSFLYKDDFTFKYEKGPISKIQAYGAYRGSINSLFTTDYSTQYENLMTQAGVYGQLRNPNYKFKFGANPIPKDGLNYLDRFVADAYITNTSIPNHQIVAGYSRVQTGVEGGASTFILPFVARSQIARNFGNSRALGVKVIGNYNYVDYNLGFGSSGRYITSGMPGTEFAGWVNVKPFGSQDKKLGKLSIGAGFNGGHNRIDYSVGSFYIGYKRKNLWTNLEAAIADGYSGSLGISSNKAAGISATAGWKFNPHLQLIGRIDQFDPNRNLLGDLKREYTIGINWFIKGQALKLMLNYIFCDNQNTKDGHKIILATQILL